MRIGDLEHLACGSDCVSSQMTTLRLHATEDSEDIGSVLGYSAVDNPIMLGLAHGFRWHE
jgi:hypothetical protein